MIKRFCDRCGEEIEDEVYYLEFKSESLLSVGFCTPASTSELCNSYAVNPVIVSKHMYCRNCRADILEYAKAPAPNHTERAECEAQDIAEENLKLECQKLSASADELTKKMRETIAKTVKQLEQKGLFDNFEKI